MTTLVIPPSLTSSNTSPSSSSSTGVPLGAPASSSNPSSLWVDDNSPLISYSPAWTEGSRCASCWASQYVSANEAYDQTWHDATFEGPSDGDVMPQAELTFNGSSISVHGITGLFSTSVSFYLDGRLVASYSSSGSPNASQTASTIAYGTELLSDTQVEAGQHTLTIVPNTSVTDIEGKNIVLLDAVVYTPLPEHQSVNHTASNAPTKAILSSPSSSTPASNIEPPNSNMIHVSIILATIGGAALLLLVILLAFLVVRRRRNTRPPSRQYKHLALSEVLERDDHKSAFGMPNSGGSPAHEKPASRLGGRNPSSSGPEAYDLGLRIVTGDAELAYNDPWDSSPPVGMQSNLKSRFSVSTSPASFAERKRGSKARGPRNWFKRSRTGGDDDLDREERSSLVNGAARNGVVPQHQAEGSGATLVGEHGSGGYGAAGGNEHMSEMEEAEHLRANIAVLEEQLSRSRDGRGLPFPSDLLSILAEPPQTPRTASRRHTLRTMRSVTPAPTVGRQGSTDTVLAEPPTPAANRSLLTPSHFGPTRPNSPQVTVATQGSIGTLSSVNTVATVEQTPEELRARMELLKRELIRLYEASNVGSAPPLPTGRQSGGSHVDLILETDEGISSNVEYGHSAMTRAGEVDPPGYMSPPPGHRFGPASSVPTSPGLSEGQVLSPPASARLAQFRLVMRDDTLDLQPVNQQGFEDDNHPVDPSSSSTQPLRLRDDYKFDARLPSPDWNTTSIQQMQPLVISTTQSAVASHNEQFLGPMEGHSSSLGAPARQTTSDTVRTGESWKVNSAYPRDSHGGSHPSRSDTQESQEPLRVGHWSELLDTLGGVSGGASVNGEIPVDRSPTTSMNQQGVGRGGDFLDLHH